MPAHYRRTPPAHQTRCVSEPSLPPTRSRLHPGRAGCGRTSRRRGSPRSPASREQPVPVGGIEPPQVHRCLRVVGPHRQLEPARRGVPRRPLPDAGLALEPPAVRLGDVLGVGMEDVERQQALRPSRSRGQPRGRRAARRRRGQVKERAERDGDEPETCRARAVSACRPRRAAGRRRAARPAVRASSSIAGTCRRRRPGCPPAPSAPQPGPSRLPARAPARRFAPPGRRRTGCPRSPTGTRRRTPARAGRRRRSRPLHYPAIMDVDALVSEATARIAGAADSAALEEIRIEALGRKAPAGPGAARAGLASTRTSAAPAATS